MSGTIENQGSLLAGVPTGGPAGGIHPVSLQNMVASEVNVMQVRNLRTVSYTPVFADYCACIDMNSSSATTVTVPPNSSVAWPVGIWFDVCAIGTGKVTIVAGAGVTLITPSTLILATQGSVVRLTQRVANVWVLSPTCALQPLPVYTAARIQDFLNGLGVNTFIYNYQWQYIDENVTTLVSNLKYCGIKSIRDHLVNNTGELALVQVFAALAAQGITLDLISPISEDGSTLVVADCVTAAANIVAAVAPGAVIAIELPNEPAFNTYTYGAATSTIYTGSTPGFLPVMQFGAALYPALKANAATKDIPVLGFSTQGGSPDDCGAQFLTIPSGYSHVTLTTNAVSTTSATLHFASVPTTGATAVIAGHYVYNTIKAWASGSFVTGQTCSYGYNDYTCTTGGTSTSQPTGTGTGINNGGTAVFAWLRASVTPTVVSVTSTTIVISQTVTVPSGTSIRVGARMPDGTVVADIINIHCYPLNNSLQYPSHPAAQLVDPTAGDQLHQFLLAETSTTWNKGFSGYTAAQLTAMPKWLSEFGFDMSGAASSAGTDNLTAGKNLITGWLNAWSQGFQRIYLFDLYDDAGTTPLWGLFQVNLTTAKTAATYLHNFTTILTDASPFANQFAPGALRIAFTNLPTTALWTLFQRSDGTFFAIVWNNVTNYNVSTDADIVVGATTVTVAFDRQGTIGIWDLTAGTTVQSSVSGNVTTFSLVDYPMIISFI